MKKTILIALSLLLALTMVGCSTKAERTAYDDAVELYEAGKYASALKLFEECGGYKKSEDYADDCRYYAAMQTLSPDSSVEDGYSGRVIDCTADNVSAYSQAVTMLEALDGYSDSNRMLRDAKKQLDKYNSEHRIAIILDTLEDQFLGYISHCEYDGMNFYAYFSDSYPVTLEVVKRGQTEAAVAESWTEVRSMFTGIVFEYLPDCMVNLVDRNGDTLGTYMRGETADQLTVLYDAATKPY